MSNLFSSGGVGNFSGFPPQASSRQGGFSGVNLLQSGAGGASNALSTFSFPSATHPSGGRLYSRDKSKLCVIILSMAQLVSNLIPLVTLIVKEL